MTEQEHGSVAMGDTGAMIEAARQELLYWDFIVPKDIISCVLNAALSNRPTQEPLCTVSMIGAGGHRWLTPYPLNALDAIPIGTPLYAAPQPAHGTSATERVPAENGEPFGLRSQMAYIAAYSRSDIENKSPVELQGWALTIIDRANRALSETPSPEPNAVTAGQGVEVKPLEWRDNEAMSPVGFYRVQRLDDKWEPIHNYSYMLPRLHGMVAALDTIEAAKAAAQADYEQRILSALATPTPKDESK